MAKPRLNALTKSLAISGVSALITLALLEGSVALLMRRPTALGSAVCRALGKYYKRRERKIIQFMPKCARYDKELCYTLRPGRHRIRSREFDVVYHVNSLGCRDDEQSLDGPEIAVVGDSFAIGWGVDQEKTFAQRIEARTGMRVLNAAVPSYGTVREMAFLRRIDLSQAKYLVIQYCDNDYEENETYCHSRNVLPIMDRHRYERIVRRHIDRTEYCFGKHALWLVRTVFRSAKRDLRRTRPSSRVQPDGPQAIMFANAVANSGLILEDLKIIVFEANERAANDGGFAAALNRLLAEERLPKALTGKMIAIDLSGGLTEEKYFRLDDHLTAEGHRFVAERLIRAMNGDGEGG